MERNSPVPALLRRCDEFTLNIDRECADRIEQIEGGFAVLTPSLLLVWALNYVIFERPGIEAETMVEVCERVMGLPGLAHRKAMTTDAAESERLEPDFKELGWEVDRDVFMLLRSAADRPPSPEVEVRCEHHPTSLRRTLLTENTSLHEQPEQLEKLVEQLLEMERRQSAVAGDRWFVADAEGQPAAATRLLSRHGVGQVEDVATLSSARNRGLARATVLAAVDASRKEGNELTFVIADADDWSLKLYQRLGFETIGTLRSFTKHPGRRPRA